MECKALRRGFLLIWGGLCLFPMAMFAQTGLSHVRVVRLSYVTGTVGMKRPASTEWTTAQVNTPLQEGFELTTAANSYAEVQFENGSTARLGEDSKMTLDQLAMDADGNKLNRLAFLQGYATFHFMPEHHDIYSVKVAEATLTPNGKCEFRADLDHGKARVEVFAGSVELEAAGKTAKVGKDHILEFNPGETELAFNTRQGIAKDSWDKWSAARDSQSRMALNDQAVPAQGPLYGWADLDAYGEWGYFPGFGYGWSPFASAGWSPYSMGMWNSFPGMGYTWISNEPWGWLPYHYGNWGFSQGFGWFWMPGNFGQWSPALVSWYSGPGWIGWAPIGVRGGGGQSIVTTIPGSSIHTGQMLTPQSVNHAPLSAGTRVTNAPFQPGAGAMLTGQPMTMRSEAFTPGGRGPHGTAPASLLMGGDAGQEASLQGGRAAHQPLRVRMGTTLGGQYAVGGRVGVFRGDAFRGEGASTRPMGMNAPRGVGMERGAAAGSPTIMPHGQHETMSPQGGRQTMGPSGGGGDFHGGPPPSAGSAGATRTGPVGAGHH